MDTGGGIYVGVACLLEETAVTGLIPGIDRKVFLQSSCNFSSVVYSTRTLGSRFFLLSLSLSFPVQLASFTQGKTSKKLFGKR